MKKNRDKRIGEGCSTPEQRKYLRDRCMSRILLHGTMMTVLKLFLEGVGMRAVEWEDVLAITMGAACFFGFFEGILVLYRQGSEKNSAYQWNKMKEGNECQIIPFQYRGKRAEAER